MLSEEDTVLTRANCGEIAPGALTELSMTTTMRITEEAVATAAFGDFDKYTMKSIVINQHFAFIDVINVSVHRMIKNIIILQKI